MVMVKPLVHRPPPLQDNEIFLVDAVDPPERPTKSFLDMDGKKSMPDKPTTSFVKQTPHSDAIASNDDKKWSRHEDTVKRKRNSISMLGKIICKYLEVIVQTRVGGLPALISKHR